ncbi:hypothetical protein V5N11_022222 [Cardamine amara subsp. amara]|uniref:Ubiquitin-like protease family profile domain-containing protein n=1 Tax=Cardamine amara subsp. amara TaxID=228776 RepID=A0ABD1BVN6_CARAN
MIPALLNEVIPPEIRKPSGKQFSFRRRKGIPQNENPGDCGVYSAKYAECLALGVVFEGLSDRNVQALRLKMAAEIYDEVPDLYAQFNF